MSGLQAQFQSFQLRFLRPMGTSRGVMTERETAIILLRDDRRGISGLGECAPLPGLSIDARPDFNAKLDEICQQISNGVDCLELDLAGWPSIRFGLETALRQLESGGDKILFDSPFTRGEQSIATNGLVVMADVDDMFRQVEAKVAAGFRCIKIKIGALDFDAELALLKKIRAHFPPQQIDLRLDANGAFPPQEALAKLERLAVYDIHSLEQPIRPGNWQEMAIICQQSPIAIALDEELIGVDISRGEEMLATIQPRYIILKPSLLGGLAASEQWIALVRQQGIGYWATSALESGIGLNAIAQWAAQWCGDMPQGLGTGRLFEHNFPAPVNLHRGALQFVASGQLPAVDDIAKLELGESG